MSPLSIPEDHAFKGVAENGARRPATGEAEKDGAINAG
jgi:hypothetical protein